VYDQGYIELEEDIFMLMKRDFLFKRKKATRYEWLLLKMIPAPRIIKNTMYKNITHSFSVFGKFFIASFLLFVMRSFVAVLPDNIHSIVVFFVVPSFSLVFRIF
jgi:hypothetical protein